MQRSQRCIVLVGYRCVGKSTVAKALAQQLHLPLFCTDTLLEEKIGMTIASFVAKEGWGRLREGEEEVVASLAQTASSCDGVVATGGGVVLSEQNRMHLKALGRVYWLQAEAHVIQSRLRQSGAVRPSLLRDMPSWLEVPQVLSERMLLYDAVADHTIEVTDLCIAEIVQRIVECERKEKGRRGQG